MNKNVKKPCPSSSSSSAETVLTDNIDLLTEILFRVPATSLLKLKSVSKQWLSLISNPKFCLSHTRLHLNPNFTTPAALFLDARNPTSEIQLVPLKNDAVSSKITSFDYLNDGAVIEIEQSCNGLLLCSSTVERNPTIYFICNPTTKQFKKVKFPNFPSDYFSSPGFVILAFDPSKSPNYNLLSIRSIGRTRLKTDFYSSETNSWIPLEIDVLMPDVDSFQFSSAVYCRGAIHWPPTSYHGISMYFDVETKLLKLMPKPPSYNRGGVLNRQIVRYFGECRGRLQLVMGLSTESENLEFDILEMALDYSKWSVRYHVHLHSFIKMVCPLYLILPRKVFSILNVVCAEKEKDSMVVIFVNGVAFAYKLRRGTSRKLCDVKLWSGLAEDLLDSRWRRAYRYFDTLLWF